MSPEIPSMDLDKIVTRTESKTYNTDWYNQTRNSIKWSEKNDPSTFNPNVDEDVFTKQLDDAYKNPITKPVTKKQEQVVWSIIKPQNSIINKSVFNIFKK